ncbi:MAG: hypothetical protein EPO09_02920 [Aquabacterium sp.]|uniref:hypothetical protein n=1 Tax=Aquabacterium sp. TaxID=1872578 RepID=UPI00122B3217|nr:hypothetical protein [Aquabacterium sp.]TAK98049.1 MAG: hypothetical protein EPO09_02920 [Aquabacterium sp.]
MTAKNLKVALMGPDIDHRRSLEAMLGAQVKSLSWMPDSLSLSQGKALSMLGRVRRAVDQLTYTRDVKFIGPACQHLDDGGADVVVAYWGTNPLSDIVALKRKRPKVKVVLMVLCYPLALNEAGVSRQHWMMRRAAKWLDGILYANPQMAHFFENQVFTAGSVQPRSTVLSPCWPASYQPAQRPVAAADRPNIIFAGRTDLSHHTVHAADDLRPLMREILDAGIELHHGRSPETTDGHPLRRPFDPLSQGQLIARMAAHDASLIAYNTAVCQRAERFDLTVPDRLITSVAAGVPIAVPAKGYTGPKSYLQRYPAVFEFDSPAHLMQQLQDRVRVQEARDAAWEARALYTAEMQGEGLASFLASLV